MTTETTGILTEKYLCDRFGINFNTNRRVSQPDDISLQSIINSIELPFVLKEHTGNQNKEFDFITIDNKTVSVKTSKTRYFKACPQKIGQTTKRKFREFFAIPENTDLKQFIYDNIELIVNEMYMHLFCCDYTLFLNFFNGEYCIINKNENQRKFANLEFNKPLNYWNESITIKDTLKNVAEIQIHNKRDCVKFRFFLNRFNLRYNLMECRKKLNGINYIGSKLRLLKFLKDNIEITTTDTFVDLFSGSGCVSRFFSDSCKTIISNDIQYYSNICSKIVSKSKIDTFKIKEIVKELNKAKVCGFITRNYTPQGNRMYFTVENGMKIDGMRNEIERLKCNGVLSEDEYILLLQVLIKAVAKVSNTTGTFGAYLKQFKKAALSTVELNMNNSDISETKKTQLITNCNAAEFDIPNDSVVYIDPPYNSRRYDTNYFMYEIICKWNYPQLKETKTGLPVTSSENEINAKRFCSKVSVKQEFEKLFNNLKKCKCKCVYQSYNSDGILSKDEIQALFTKCGYNVKLIETDYQRYSSHRIANKNVIEYLFKATPN